MLSVSSCRTSLDRLAPKDRRMLISLRRALARESNKLATLAQAMSSTNPTTLKNSAAIESTVPCAFGSPLLTG